MVTEDALYMLRYNVTFVEEALNGGSYDADAEEDGLEEAFDIVEQFSEVPLSAAWVAADCFVYVGPRGTISYVVGSRVLKLGAAGRKQHILGYDAKANRLYLVDKALNLYGHRLLTSVVSF